MGRIKVWERTTNQFNSFSTRSPSSAKHRFDQSRQTFLTTPSLEPVIRFQYSSLSLPHPLAGGRKENITCVTQTIHFSPLWYYPEITLVIICALMLQ